VRAILEPYAARLAIEAAGSDATAQAEVAGAYRHLKAVVDAGDPLAVADADIGFHRAVFARCGHQMLLGNSTPPGVDPPACPDERAVRLPTARP
jgi:DNA-binding GntR family transcriptional regulator